ncbi:MAG: DUF288 domain-containing protein [Gammaproteobacteria bacterium]|nr:DUF288 domain-containing protein [Gammaproteobacteria bacterium]
MSTTDETILVVTSIAAPTECMRLLAAGARERGARFYCIGDVPSPPHFLLEGCDFLGLDEQRKLPYHYANVAPERHYARKNIGYLKAMACGAGFILETDDDNYPTAGFWDMRIANDICSVSGSGWYNVYEWFGADAWPRGFPLDRVLVPNQGFELAASSTIKPLVWQGMVAGEPDVDAIFRLTRRQSIVFQEAPPVVLGRGVWSPFNSQNTHWAAEAFPLMYLPATCSFRATDIVRGYVAMRCLWEMEAGVAFSAPTAMQERNLHDLMRDFRDEIIIYEGAARIVSALEELELASQACCDNLMNCYRRLVELKVVQPAELQLLAAWCRDVVTLGYA